MRRLFLFLLITVFAASCEDKQTSRPEGLIEPRKLENILYDMQLADVYSLSVRKDTTEHYGTKNQDSLARYYNEIFAHYGVTYRQFDVTMQWYKEHPPYLDTLYTNVLNRMSVEEERYKYTTPEVIAAPKPEVIPDSLKDSVNTRRER